MTEVDNALSEIADIRARMAAGTRFRGVAPEAVAFTSLLALLVAGLQAAWPETLAAEPIAFVTVWAAAAMLAAGVMAVEALGRSRREHGPLADLLLASTVRLLLPFGAAGAAIAFVICRVAPEAAWTLPGLWQILIALTGFASASALPRAIVWPAGWYFISGTLVLALAGQDGRLSPWMMGLPFAIGQAWVALVLHRDARLGRG